MTKDKMNKKKLLHIIHIIYDVLSALFIVFVSSALLINAVQNADKKTQDILTPNIQEVEHKTRRDYVRTPSGYYEYGATDLFSYDFAVNLINYYVTQYNADFLEVTSSQIGQYVITTSNTHQMFCYNQQGTYVSAFYVNNISLEKKVWGSSYNSYYYKLTFSNSSPYDKWLMFEWDVQRTSDNQLRIFGCSFDVSSSLLTSSFTTSAYGWMGRAMLSENSSSSQAFLYSLMNNNSKNYEQGYDIGKQAGYDEGYQTAYNQYQDGLNTAYSRGYDVGYDVGYIDGVDSDGVNAFGLIGQAFDAVSDVLSIEILPGFQLWVLVTTPLIIAVVIVVVKLIKG